MTEKKLKPKALADCLLGIGRGQSPTYVEGESSVYAINQKCVRNGSVNTAYARPHDPLCFVKDSAFIQHGDICINSTGTGTIGRVGLWSEIETGKFFADSHITIVRPNTEFVNPSYLAAVLQSPTIQSAMETYCFSGSTNQVELNKSALSELKLNLLPRKDQEIVANIYASIDQPIEQTKAIIAKQQRIKIGLMQDLLTKGIDENGNIRSENTHEFKDSPLGRVPVEWEVAELRERAIVRGGKRLPSGHVYSENDTDFRYLQTTDFINKHLKYSAMHFLFPLTFKFLERYEIINGDIFISIAGVNLGVAGVFRPDIPDRTILTENAAKIELNGSDIPEFIATQINGPIIQMQIEADKGVGAGVPKLALFRIQSLFFPWPHPDEQREIVKRIKSIDSTIEQEIDMLSKFLKIKTGLMHDLLTGYVQVTDI